MRMASIGALGNILPRLRDTSLAKHLSTSDAELVERFVSQRDELAFEVILRRHGPMVLNVCLRVLRLTHDAEDAFQATFLVLAHKAATVSPRSNLAGWLHGVAHKTALKSRYKSSLRLKLEKRVHARSQNEMLPNTKWDEDEVEAVLDQEIAILPDRYRLPIILCYLEGRLQVDVADILGCSVGTLSSRLTRGRRLLAERLKRRGFGPSVAAIGVVLAKRSSALAESLIRATVPAVLSSLAAPAGVGSAVSSSVAQLATGVMKNMFLKKLQTVAFVSFGAVVTFAAIALIGIAAYESQAATLPKTPQAPAVDRKAIGETLNYTGKVFDKKTGKPIVGAVVTIRPQCFGDPEQKELDQIFEETKHTTDAEGKYSFTIPPEQNSQPSLVLGLDVYHPDYAPRKSDFSLRWIRMNEKSGARPFFESIEMWPAKPTTGVVHLPNGKPAAGVKIMAFSIANYRENSQSARFQNGSFGYGSAVETRTDESGTFRLSLASPGLAIVWILPVEYIPTTHILNERRGDIGTFTLASGPRFKGKLLDAKGKPVAGVILNARPQKPNPDIPDPRIADMIMRSAVTNDKGEFEMKPLPPGDYLVQSDRFPADYSLDGKELSRQADVPGIFLRTKVTLKAGTEPESVEMRAVPHVTIETHHVDSKGKPIRGYIPYLDGYIDGVHWVWAGVVKSDSTGKLIILVPHGLENTQFVPTRGNDTISLRWRKGRNGTLNDDFKAMLGTMIDDVKDIECVHYVAPMLLLKVITKDGAPLVDVAITARYNKSPVAPERNSTIPFWKQVDGRFRSDGLLPDEELVVKVHVDGYADKTEKVSPLAEGKTLEFEIVLEKAPAAKAGEKKDK
jgi:RNA polymerase sigma factor (sigma-70 family)